MKILETIKTTELVALDIETVRVAEHYDDLDTSTKSAWATKNKSEGVTPSEDELALKWTESASLYAEFSKVCAVSMAFRHGDEVYCKEMYGESELDILNKTAQTLDNILKRGLKTGTIYRLVGHSARFFDYPFLCKRYLVNGLTIPALIDSTSDKPWTANNLDTNELWKMGGTGYGSSLEALCNVLQIPSSKVLMHGDDVGQSYYQGEYSDIGRYCSYDAVATLNIMFKFKQEPIVQFDDVVYMVDAEESEEKLTVLQRLHYEDYLSPEIESELRDHFVKLKIKMTKKAKSEILSILKAAYVKQEFMNSDTKETIERKTNELLKFIDTL